MSTREEILDEREKLRATYGALFDDVAQILFLHDPAEINCGANSDEYEHEVGTILPRLHACSHADGARRIVIEELTRWFSGCFDTLRASSAAADIWRAWERFTKAPRE